MTLKDWIKVRNNPQTWRTDLDEVSIQKYSEGHKSKMISVFVYHNGEYKTIYRGKSLKSAITISRNYMRSH